MKKGLVRSLIFGATAVAGVFLFTQTASAVSGRCDSCHTMHNSQDGAAVGTSSAQSFLLRDICSGCHSRTDTTSPINATTRAPAVTHTADITGTSFDARATGASYLAGGSFRWVETAGSEFGHNVAELTQFGVDPLLNDPPGDTGSNYATGSPLTCNDTSGGVAGSLTGCHYGGGHHSNSGGVYNDGVNPSPNAADESVFVSGASVGASYRFLSGGTLGAENADWEWTYATRDHNIYAASATFAGALASGSLTNVCIRCHGDFHGAWSAPNGTGTGPAAPWYRHPTDVDLGGAGVDSEHAAYGSYDPIVPIGTDNPAAALTLVSGVAWDSYNERKATGVGFNKVTCVSCHRAHGSEYPDALRWSYGKMSAGTTVAADAGTGCFKCHSDKDGI